MSSQNLEILSEKTELKNFRYLGSRKIMNTKRNPFKINFKSNKKVLGKPKKEVHQYVGVGDESIISRIEIDRKKNGKNKTVYKIFRWSNGVILK